MICLTTLDLTESRNLIDDTIENSLFDHEIDTNEDVEDISNPKTTPEPQISSYLPGMQLILFGAPGTGKSNKLRHGLNINDGVGISVFIAVEQLKQVSENLRTVATVYFFDHQCELFWLKVV